MDIKNYRHPFLFYALSTIIPWTLWFSAAYLSHMNRPGNIHVLGGSILGIAGLFAPMIIAFTMMYRNPELKKDLFGRLFRLNRVKPFYLFLTFFLMLASILLAQGISLFFGFSANQFRFAQGFSFSYAIFPAWFMLLLSPAVEELAWHSYGTDSLRSRFNLFTTSIIFAVYWALWHFPLSFIKDYYHSNLVEIGWIYSLNFYFSIIPLVIVMNWLYYKTERNILVIIIFHITAGFFNEIFATHPFSKVIQTVLLIALAAFLIVREKDFFFNKEYTE